MRQVVVSVDPLDPAGHLNRLSKLGGGAVASFTGIVRSDDAVEAIELEHYPAMTAAALNKLVDSACDRWDLLGVVLQHRVGRIAVGEPIVFVGTVSSHRQAALESCAYLIDWLKTDAPFWKKEHISDGDARWVEERCSDIAARDRWQER